MRRDARIPHRRKGSMLLEMSVSTVLIGTVLLLIAQLIAGMTAVLRSHQDRQWALNEAQNLLEHVYTRPWNELTDGSTTRTISEEATKRAASALRDGRVVVAIEPSAETLDALRLRVEVSWARFSGMPVRPVRLVAWRHRSEGEPTP